MEITTQSRYIDITTDYGFKRIFVSKTNKDLLISFLTNFLEAAKLLLISITTKMNMLVMRKISGRLSLI